MIARTDRNNNPTAFTSDLAHEAGLILNVDYVIGDPFPMGPLFTAKILSDPIAVTIKLLDKVGYYTSRGLPRWTYIAIPSFIWQNLTPELKKKVIAFHYQHEGGTEMKGLFS